MIALTKGAIDFSRNRLFVLHTKWRKDKRKTEGNPVSEEVRTLLSALCREAQGELLFTSKEGQKLTRYEVDGAFRRACARAGVTGLRFHDLRHEYGSRLGDADVNLKKIARLMGHSNNKQTERYVHPDDDGLLKATTVASTSEPARILPGRLRKVK